MTENVKLETKDTASIYYDVEGIDENEVWIPYSDLPDNDGIGWSIHIHKVSDSIEDARRMSFLEMEIHQLVQGVVDPDTFIVMIQSYPIGISDERFTDDLQRFTGMFKGQIILMEAYIDSGFEQYDKIEEYGSINELPEDLKEPAENYMYHKADLINDVGFEHLLKYIPYNNSIPFIYVNELYDKINARIREVLAEEGEKNDSQTTL